MSQCIELFKEFNKKCKSDVFTVGSAIHDCARIPFSSPKANRMLYGGIPRGRITEFAGADQSGKTTTALDITGNAQKLFQAEWETAVNSLVSLEKPTKEQTALLKELQSVGPKRVLWIDVENTFDDDWAVRLGVDIEILYYMSPTSEQSAEMIFEMVVKLIATGEIGLVVIDSIAMMLSEQEIEKEIGDKTYGGISMALTRFSREVVPVCSRTNCALIGINQLRDNLATGYNGPITKTPGGRCWKHACSVRLEFRQGSSFDKDYKQVAKNFENPIGHNVLISVSKTKVSKPDRKLGQYTLVYTEGIVPLIDAIDEAIKLDVIHQSGAWFTFIDPETGETLVDDEDNVIKIQGKNNILPFISQEENTDIKQFILKKVNESIYQ